MMVHQRWQLTANQLNCSTYLVVTNNLLVDSNFEFQNRSSLLKNFFLIRASGLASFKALDCFNLKVSSVLNVSKWIVLRALSDFKLKRSIVTGFHRTTVCSLLVNHRRWIRIAFWPPFGNLCATRWVHCSLLFSAEHRNPIIELASNFPIPSHCAFPRRNDERNVHHFHL